MGAAFGKQDFVSSRWCVCVFQGQPVVANLSQICLPVHFYRTMINEFGILPIQKNIKKSVCFKQKVYARMTRRQLDRFEQAQKPAQELIMTSN